MLALLRHICLKRFTVDSTPENRLYEDANLKIIDTRIDANVHAPDEQGDASVFVDDDFYLAIWHKTSALDVGCAKQPPDGGYFGYVTDNMLALTIHAASLVELADIAHACHLRLRQT